MATITLNRPTEDLLNVLVDGEPVGSFDHDQHGWAGMEAAEKLVVKLAEKLGIEIEETFDDSEV